MRSVKSIILLLLMTIVSTADSLADNIPSLATITKKSEEIVQQYEKLGWFSGSLLLANNGTVFYSQSYGMQDAEAAKQNSEKTRYNIGSIIKNFTGVLILQQVEQGKLHLSDTLAKFDLGFSNPQTDKITIEQLLNHRSGLPDIFTAQYRENPLAFDTINKRLGLLLNTNLLFEPGAKEKYSNYGYVVLGAILEKVTNKTFEKLLHERIFSPAQMNNTSFKVDTNYQYQSKRYSYSYDNSLKEVGVTEHPGPDGGIESSIDDIHRFYRALFYSDKLLSRRNKDNRRFFKMDGERWRSYGGGLGVSAAAEIDLKNAFEVIVLANSDSLVAEFISQRIIDFIETGQYEAVKAKEVNFAYQHYLKTKSFNDLNHQYKIAGYRLFIGRTLNELGMQLIREGKWPEAFDAFNYLKSLYPNAPQVYDSLAFAYYKQGNKEKAKATFKMAIALDAYFNSEYASNNYEN